MAETISTQADRSIGDVGVDETYISQRDWLTPPGRADLIDPVADEHERRSNGRRQPAASSDEVSG